MKNIYYIIFTLLFVIFSCCNSDNSKYQNKAKIVTDLSGKTIIIPENFVAQIGEISIPYDFSNADYKIVTYIDTTGCTPCRMKISSWNELINEFKSIPDVDLNFLMIINSDRKNAAEYAINASRFNHPIWFDYENSFFDINSLPDDDDFHTFLIDADDKIVAVGDPVKNPKIKALYKNIISGDYEDKSLKLCAKPTYAAGVVAPGEIVKHHYILRNSDTTLLTIQAIIPSCDCTDGRACSDSLKIKGKIGIDITYRADTIIGPFFQYVDIFFNEIDEPQRLIIYGNIFFNN